MMWVMFLLTGCGDSMPEDELVNRGASRMENDGDDLQASSFPFLNMEEEYQKKREFYTLPETITGRKWICPRKSLRD